MESMEFLEVHQRLNLLIRKYEQNVKCGASKEVLTYQRLQMARLVNHLSVLESAVQGAAHRRK